MKSVLIFIESLDLGGAESVLKDIICNIDKSKYDITVVSEKDGEFHTEEIKKHVRHRSFVKQKRNATAFGRFINKLIIKFSVTAPPALVRKLLIIGKYDIEIAFCEGFATKIIGAGKKSKAKRIAWVHTDILNHPWSEKIFGGPEIEKLCYEKFDRIACVSQTVKQSIENKYGIKDKAQVIYNVIDSEKIIAKSREPVSAKDDKLPRFVLTGSSEKVKGYDRLVEVCNKLFCEGYRFNVTIMGSGSEFGKIVSMVKKYNMDEYFSIMEYQANPYKYMKAADCYICSSYAEGYSIAVCEAVICGLPVITTECSGMREIFGDAEIGIICENNEAGLYTAIKSVLDNPEKLDKFKSNIPKRAADLSLDKRIKEVEMFFDSI